MKTLLDEKNDWQKIREKILSNGYNRTGWNDDWKDAIFLFEESFNQKFILPLKNMRDNGDQNGEGYSIVSIICVLIEILASYRYGSIYRYIEKGDEKEHDYEYFNSRELLIKFLSNIQSFKNTFDTIKFEYDNIQNDECYKDFYWNVRCALIHEGQLKNGWIISSNALSDNTDKIFIFFENGYKIIYREVLLSIIGDYFTSYLSWLRSPKSLYDSYRMNFARRFDNHFGLNYTDWEQ